ncbi:hypothetical protein [Micromonospora sp. DPT]|uniref:hypothetical protein n=1 Tax=Micromonospora sp. DPT TaxID=3142975 RepID=UPI0032095CE6
MADHGRRGAGERALIGEVCLFDADRQARYVRPDELHQAFTFELLECAWSAPALRDTIGRTLEAYRRVGALPAWVLSSHDAVRTGTRYGGGEPGAAPGAGRRPADVGAARRGLRLPGGGVGVASGGPARRGAP